MVNISAKFDKTNRDKLDSGLPDNNEANTAVAVRVSAFGALSRIKPAKPSLKISFAINITKALLAKDSLEKVVGAILLVISKSPKPTKDIKAFNL